MKMQITCPTTCKKPYPKLIRCTTSQGIYLAGSDIAGVQIGTYAPSTKTVTPCGVINTFYNSGWAFNGSNFVDFDEPLTLQN